MREKLVFGTAALGLAYGLGREGEPPTLMCDAAATNLVHAAIAAGVDTFDTAPSYGLAEERLGLILGPKGRIWTKVGRERRGALVDEVSASVERSLATLRRPTLQLVQWHNWTADLAKDTEFRQAWRRLQADARLLALGATTYGPSNALAAVESGFFSIVQVEWNLLNQGVLEKIAPSAQRRQVAIAVRSVLLQGALTDQNRRLPDRPALAAGVEKARTVARRLGLRLEHLALRAALADERIAHVLIGFDRPEQIEDALLQAGAAAGLPSIAHLDLGGDPSADPRTW